MSRGDDLIPLKRVLELADVSRSTLWRVSRSGLEGFPKPQARGRRLFWREEDVAAIRLCIDAFDGRTVFDRKMKNERGRRERRHAALAALKHRKARARPSRSGNKKPVQGDLFKV